MAHDSSTATSRITRLALVAFGVAVGYLVGRETRRSGRRLPAGPPPVGPAPAGTMSTGPNPPAEPTATRRAEPAGTHQAEPAGTRRADPAAGASAPVRPATAPRGQRPGVDLGYRPGLPADQGFAADTVSGASATTASDSYEVLPGRTTASPTAPIGHPVEGRRPASGRSPHATPDPPAQPDPPARPDEPAPSDPT
ncbi:hypothetical protein O7632_26660 [Solwaraspora sp. WMMD406]|uniref:hypothetical protein n=1 Tax=Solwaraspora sp. WMMD406 TaxID=3016095 RepID=UPI00241641C8|nr:hypothetical protein [Solwaraspora sp. WMMD406]MDG4767647.1 hypothetical protein [Solwaraspora sp. WMMD406]